LEVDEGLSSTSERINAIEFEYIKLNYQGILDRYMVTICCMYLSFQYIHARREYGGINTLLEIASMEIGGLNSFADLIPNIDVYIKMHIKTEANKSSKIEGTKTSIEEELLQIEDVALA
jgi:hypothetical protein